MHLKLKEHQLKITTYVQIDRYVGRERESKKAIYKRSGSHKPKVYNRHRHQKGKGIKMHGYSLNQKKIEQKMKGTKRTIKTSQKQ